MTSLQYTKDKYSAANIFRLAVFLIGILLCSLQPVFSQGFGPRMGRAFERLAENLELDEETQQQVQQITAAFQEELSQLRQQLREAYQQMRTLLDADIPDEAAVMQQADMISNIRAAMEKARLRTMLRVRVLLTPDQRAELREKMQSRPPFGRRRHGGGPDRGFFEESPFHGEP